MVETSFSSISKDYYISNEKIYPKNNICYKISNNVKFDAKKFAEWMQKCFRNSPYKTITSLANAAESNKATISRLMSGAAQTLTNKPSQPSQKLVKKLAVIFNEPIDDALLLAGHAPIKYEYDSHDILEGVKIQFNQSVKLSKKDKEKILEITRTVAKGVLAEHENTHELSQEDKN